MRLSSLLILAFCITGTAAQTICSGSGTGTWSTWSDPSSSCETCDGAGTPANGVFRIRFCIPPEGSGCVYDDFSCPGDAVEKTPCGTTTTVQTTTTTSVQTTTTPGQTTTTPSSDCGAWTEWSCSCCGGCITGRCRRTCQDTGSCAGPATCTGSSSKEDTAAPCVSPSEACSFPLAICCDGQRQYINMTSKSRWCKDA